jgi:hypothetical protein
MRKDKDASQDDLKQLAEAAATATAVLAECQ